jgi:TFIIF-interacting CTD phosphatase-like protein
MDIIVLDLDQTVISSEILRKSCAEEGDKIYDIEANREKSKLFRYQNMEGLYVIFERPHLQEFLDFLFTHFRVGIWTAASQDYANFIVKNIIIGDNTNRKLDFFMCSYHGEKSSDMYKGPKDLDMIVDLYKLPGSYKAQIVIVDDYGEVYKVQPRNCILAKEFCYFNLGSDKDDFLLKVIDNLKRHLANKEDGGHQASLGDIVEEINSK